MNNFGLFIKIEFMQVCPSGKMKKKHFYKFYKMLRGTDDDKLHKITDYVHIFF